MTGTNHTNIESALVMVYVTTAETVSDSITRFVSSKVHSITLNDVSTIIENLVEKGMDRTDAKRAILRAYRASRPSEDLCWAKLDHYKKTLKEMRKRKTSAIFAVCILL